MKTNVKTFFLVLLSVMVAGATLSASASAYEYGVEGAAIAEATNIEGTSGLLSLLVGTIGGAEAKIDCTQDTLTGKLELGGKGTSTLLLKKCTESKPVHCSVPETIEGKLKDKLIGTATPEELFEAASGGTIAEVTITGSECVVKGTYSLKGTQNCELPKAEEELAEHEIVCKKSGSSLKLGTETASFSSTEKAKLVSGKKWSVLRPPPRIEEVDFKSNQAVLIDHRANVVPETAQSIKGFDGDEIEWKSPKAGEVTKNWPVVYVRQAKIDLDATFALEAATRELLEKKAEGEPEVTGEATIGGTTIKLEKKFTLPEIKKQLEEHKEYLETKEVESNTLPNKVLYALATITWKWKIKEAGRANLVKQELGKSTHSFYLLYKATRAGTTVYLTLLDVDTLGLEEGAQPPTEENAIPRIWKGYSTLEAEVPSVHIRTYKPATATGELSRTGNVLKYYSEVASGQDLEKLYETLVRTCAGVTPAGLLELGEGRCGAWAYALINALETEGIEGKLIHLFAQFGAAKEPCSAAYVCSMLVKKWLFLKAGLEEPFPFEAKAVEDVEGVPGQGVKNPPPFFWDHAIVKAGPALYDPSYGIGPFSGKEGLKEGEEPSESSVLKEYQKQSMDGFCRSNLAEQEAVEKSEKEVAKPVSCQETPAKLELKSEVPFAFP